MLKTDRTFTLLNTILRGFSPNSYMKLNGTRDKNVEYSTLEKEVEMRRKAEWNEKWK